MSNFLELTTRKQVLLKEQKNNASIQHGYDLASDYARSPKSESKPTSDQGFVILGTMSFNQQARHWSLHLSVLIGGIRQHRND